MNTLVPVRYYRDGLVQFRRSARHLREYNEAKSKKSKIRSLTRACKDLYYYNSSNKDLLKRANSLKDSKSSREINSLAEDVKERFEEEFRELRKQREIIYSPKDSDLNYLVDLRPTVEKASEKEYKEAAENILIKFHEREEEQIDKETLEDLLENRTIKDINSLGRTIICYLKETGRLFHFSLDSSSKTETNNFTERLVKNTNIESIQLEDKKLKIKAEGTHNFRLEKKDRAEFEKTLTEHINNILETINDPKRVYNDFFIDIGNDGPLEFILTLEQKEFLNKVWPTEEDIK